MPILGLSLKPAVSYYSFVKFMFLPSAKVKPYGTLIVSLKGEERGRKMKREVERKRKGERMRERQTDDETLCKLTLYGFRRGWLLIDSAERVAGCNKKCNGASLVTSRCKTDRETCLFLVKIIDATPKTVSPFISVDDSIRITINTL